MKVSVLINNYNYGEFLDDCLKSLENQTEKADEVILYDDGSTDNSLEIAAKYKFVKILSNPNFGDKPAFNQANAIYQALKTSTGDIICLLDSDDFFHPEKIATIKKSFLLKDIVLVQHAYFEWINNKVNRTVNFGMEGVNYKTLYQQKKWTGFFNPTSTLSFSRDYLLKVLPVSADKQWKVWADVRLSRVAPYFGKIICLRDPLAFYRRHGNNDSSLMNLNNGKVLENQIEHHDYVNLQLTKLNFEVIDYKRSFIYFKFKLKAILPKFFVVFVSWVHKKVS